MLTGSISFLLLLFIFLLIIKKNSFFQIDSWSKKSVYYLFAIKFLAALCLWFIYTQIYTIRFDADVFKYFDDAAAIFKATDDQLSERWKLILGLQNDLAIKDILANTQHWDSTTSFIFNDNRTLSRIHLIIYHLSRGFYPLHLLVFSFLSLMGSVGIFKFFKIYSSLPTAFLLIISFLLPSVLFWASAPLKETVVIFGLGMFLYGLSATLVRFEAKNFFLFVIGLLCLLSMKIFIFLSLLPGLIFLVISSAKKSLKFSVVFICTLGLFLLLAFIIQDFLLGTLLSKQLAFKALLKNVVANSRIPVPSFSSLSEFCIGLPHALFNVFIKPLWPPNWSPFALVAAAEHFFYLSALLLPVFFFKKPKRNDLILVLFSLSFLVIASLIIGFTVPVLGAVVRYKAPLLPFYLICIFTFVDFSKLTQKFR